MRTFFVWVGACLATGCASISNLQTADTLGRGGYQVGIEAGTLLAASTAPETPAADRVTPIPHVDVAGRFGVSDGVDVGLRAGLSGLEAQGKFLFTQPGDPKLAISFAPTVGGLLVSGTVGIINVGLPVLIGFKFGGSELVLGPRVQNLVLLAGSSAVWGVAAGGSLGFFIRFTDNFGIMPEASVVVPVAGASAFSSQFVTQSALGSQVLVGQFKLGVMIGRFRPLNHDVQQAPPPVPVNNPPLPPPGS